MSVIKHQVSARAGLIGNPSDGYFGKTISVLVRDFNAEVKLKERSDKKIVLPHDKNEFKSIVDLFEHTSTKGFYDAGRLFKAAVAVFFEYSGNINDKGFKITYKTNIPRMVGLAGSSAIITGTMKCLMDFYNVSIKPEILANLVLKAETEKLGISAGLQDRVVQAFDKLMFMDFSKEAFRKNNGKYGYYEELNCKLPNLYLLYNSNPSESGKVHSDIRSRYNSKDPSVRLPVKKAMKYFVSLTDLFRKFLLIEDYKTCMELQNENFDSRRILIGDDKIGKDNLEMINLAREAGCSSKFSGSGGAVVGIYPTESAYKKLEEKVKDKPYSLVKVKV